jgi:hypothetical protein
MSSDSFNEAVARAAKAEQIKAAARREAETVAAAAATTRKGEQDRAADAIENLIAAFQRALVEQGMPGCDVVTVRPETKKRFGSKSTAFTIRRAVLPEALPHWYRIGEDNKDWSSGTKDLVVAGEAAWVGQREHHDSGSTTAPFRAMHSWVYEKMVASSETVDGLREILASYPSYRSHPQESYSQVYETLVLWIAQRAPSLRLEI